MISNLMAILLQALAARLGIATGRDLAQACRDSYSPAGDARSLWCSREIAIAACDLAEVIGSAIALNLLFGMPLAIGASAHGAGRAGRAALQHRGFRYVEALVVALIAAIAGCFAVRDPGLAAGPRRRVARWVPAERARSCAIREMLYIAIGILGATVMPHNLYLHSSIVQTRKYERHADRQAGGGPLRADSTRPSR